MKIFGFDFSIAKPAMCYYNTDTKEMKFYCWPMSMDKKSIEILSSCSINVHNRNLVPMSSNNFDGQQMIIENTKRSMESACMISTCIDELIGDTDLSDVYVVTEGLSYASKGNQTLDLSGYKYVMLVELYRLGIRNITTLTPSAIKHVAAMGKKMRFDKEFMIDAIKTTNPEVHPFIKRLITDENSLKKQTAFVKCVDDLVDAYWATRALCENFLNVHDLK
jgi:hypothetical protein